MKKSLLITMEFPPQMGGVATYYYNICKNLPTDKIIVLAPEYPDSQNFDKKQNFTIIRSHIINRLINSKKIFAKINQLKLLKLITNLTKSHDIEMLQVGNILPLGTLAWLNKKITKTPYLTYTHGLDILLPQKIARKTILLKKIIKESAHLIANSYFTSDELIKIGAGKELITVVYPCSNISSNKLSHHDTDEIGQLKQHYNLKNNKVIITVGRLIKRKGHDLVIQALPNIIKKIPEAVYLIVGDGPEKKRLEKIARQNSVASQVKFFGPANEKDLPALYSLSDIFVMPARQIGPDVEGFGIVYLEANLFGKPVIGGRSGGVDEAIIDNVTGILINPDNADELAVATIKLLTDTAYAHRLGIQGMERVLEYFNWEEQAKKIEEILN